MSIIVLTLGMFDANMETVKLKESLPLIDDFLLSLQTNNYSPETFYNYERDLLTLTYFLNYELKKKFDEIDKGDVEQYKAYLLSQDRKTAIMQLEGQVRLQSGSVNRTLSSLRSFLKFLIFRDYKIPVEPESVKLVKKESKHYKVAELGDLIRLIESPSVLEKDRFIAARNRAMLELLFSTGMRISELLSINKRDIDSSGKIFIIGKGKKERFVYLTKRALYHLNQYILIRNDNPASALFVPLKGTRKNTKNCRISTNYLQEKIKNYREKLNIIVPTSAHSIRHGFATYLAEEGASPAAIQLLLGHESLNTTTRYINASDRFAEEAHRKFHPLAEPDEKE